MAEEPLVRLAHWVVSMITYSEDDADSLLRERNSDDCSVGRSTCMGFREIDLAVKRFQCKRWHNENWGS
jgi:hypothetical protein